MQPRTIANYGGPFQNERLPEDPETEVDALYFDRALEDVAQLTNAAGFGWYKFTTTTTSAPTTLAANTVSVACFFGNGTAQKPTVAKTATGVYTLTFPSEFDDALVGVENMASVEETQSVVFTFASQPNVFGTNGYARVDSLASNVVTVKVYNTSDALSDLSGGVEISGFLR